MKSTVKKFLFIALYVVGCTLLTALIAYLCGALFGLAMTLENNLKPQSTAGSYLWWANFMGVLFMTFASLPGAFIGLLWGIAARFGKPAQANT
jgi:hypothetical protein